MKKWVPFLSITLLVLVTILVLYLAGLFKTMSSDDLQKSISVLDVKTKWVKKYYQPWPPKLILVPAIAFRIKNTGDKPLQYINFNTNFSFRDDYQTLGNAFLTTIRKKALPPGETSDEIFLQSNYGVEGKTKASFPNNPNWKVVVCKLFASSQGSHFIELGNYPISKEIDFEEPEEVKK